MALQELNFNFKKKKGSQSIPGEWFHAGVVGSGDMEVLLCRKELAGAVQALVRTPVTGFDQVWETVLQRFIEQYDLGNLTIEINDNNATPYIVFMRLQQAFLEAKGGEQP